MSICYKVSIEDSEKGSSASFLVNDIDYLLSQPFFNEIQKDARTGKESTVKDQVLSKLSNIRLAKTLNEVIYEFIQGRLAANDYDVVKTAKEIQFGKSTIYRMIKEGKIKKPK